MGRTFECIIQPMKKGNWSLLIWLALAAVAVVMGVQSWQEFRAPAVVIEWETASELDTAGFNLFRGEQESGPFQQINEALIPGAADPITGESYEFVDVNVSPGKTYYYQLEEVELSGARVIVETTAVQAAAGGRLELVLSGIMIVVAIVGFIGQLRADSRAEKGTA